MGDSGQVVLFVLKMLVANMSDFVRELVPATGQGSSMSEVSPLPAAVKSCTPSPLASSFRLAPRVSAAPSSPYSLRAAADTSPRPASAGPGPGHRSGPRRLTDRLLSRSPSRSCTSASPPPLRRSAPCSLATSRHRMARMGSSESCGSAENAPLSLSDYDLACASEQEWQVGSPEGRSLERWESERFSDLGHDDSLSGTWVPALGDGGEAGVSSWRSIDGGGRMTLAAVLEDSEGEVERTPSAPAATKLAASAEEVVPVLLSSATGFDDVQSTEAGASQAANGSVTSAAEPESGQEQDLELKTQNIILAGPYVKVVQKVATSAPDDCIELLDAVTITRSEDRNESPDAVNITRSDGPELAAEMAKEMLPKTLSAGCSGDCSNGRTPKNRPYMKDNRYLMHPLLSSRLPLLSQQNESPNSQLQLSLSSPTSVELMSDKKVSNCSSTSLPLQLVGCSEPIAASTSVKLGLATGDGDSGKFRVSRHNNSELSGGCCIRDNTSSSGCYGSSTSLSAFHPANLSCGRVMGIEKSSSRPCVALRVLQTVKILAEAAEGPVWQKNNYLDTALTASCKCGTASGCQPGEIKYSDSKSSGCNIAEGECKTCELVQKEKWERDFEYKDDCVAADIEQLTAEHSSWWMMVPNDDWQLPRVPTVLPEAVWCGLSADLDRPTYQESCCETYHPHEHYARSMSFHCERGQCCSNEKQNSRNLSAGTAGLYSRKNESYHWDCYNSHEDDQQETSPGGSDFSLQNRDSKSSSIDDAGLLSRMEAGVLPGL